MRERPEDIPDLVRRFFSVCKRKQEWPRLTLPDSLIPYFSAYRWPGNIRELENVIESLVVLTQDDEIRLNNLPDSIRLQTSLELRGSSFD